MSLLEKQKLKKVPIDPREILAFFSFRFLKTLEQYINVSLYVLMLLAFHYSWNEFHLFPIVHSTVDCSTSSWTGEFLTLSKSWIVHTSCCSTRTTTIGNKNMHFDTKQGLSLPYSSTWYT